MPIGDVEKHIKHRGHLPGIPSRAKIEKEGLNLSQFQMQLLKKIEELTLYTIKQEAELQALKSELDRLRKHDNIETIKVDE